MTSPRCSNFWPGIRLVERWGLTLACLMVCLAGLTGCGGKAPPRPGQAALGKMMNGSLSGRWRLHFVSQGSEVDFCLLEIEPETGTVKIVELAPQYGAAKFDSSEIKDETVKLKFEAPQQDGPPIPITFEGTLEGESIWGNLFIPYLVLETAKLEPTELEKFDPEAEPRPASNQQEFMQAATSSDSYASIHDFIAKVKKSPLLLKAYPVLAQHFKHENYTEAEIQQVIKDFRAKVAVWGDRLAPLVDLEIGASLARQEIFPKLMEELLNKAQKEIPETYPTEWQLQLANAWVDAGKPEIAMKSLEGMKERLADNPYFNFALARTSEKTGQLQQALELYASLAVIPLLERGLREIGPNVPVIIPSEAAARIWKNLHNNTDGLDDYLNQVYLEKIHKIAPERKPLENRKPTDRVVLFELFTGAACPPCVGIDIALDALQSVFPPAELIVLRYHEHIPAPDPLSNQYCTSRLDQYRGQGTPTLVANGEIAGSVGGYFPHAAQFVHGFTPSLEADLKTEKCPEIKLAVTREGDEISVSAEVANFTPSEDEPQMLRIVLVEDQIPYLAPNGIRLHDGVVRGPIGERHGFELKADALKHTAQINVEQLKAKLTKDLSLAEKDFDFSFPVKPMELKHLAVVAFVQKGTIGPVLQACRQPVPDLAGETEPKESAAK